MNVDEFIVEKKRLSDSLPKKPRASVVVVTYNTDAKLLAENLSSLFSRTETDFEVIVVDNSDHENLEPIVCDFPVKYIKLKENFGLSIGRNVGIHYAAGDIVIFLDDDAVPAADFVEEHVHAYDNNRIVGLRGKSLPRTHTVYNCFSLHYDLGEEAFPYYVNLEGNSSFKKDVLEQVGGFYTEIKRAGGYEGAELSYRIVNYYKDKSKLIYYPGAVIYHDNCGSFAKYYRKKKRHQEYKKMLQENFPGLFEFMESYPQPGKTGVGERHSLFTRLRLWFIRKAVRVLLLAARIREKKEEK